MEEDVQPWRQSTHTTGNVHIEKQKHNQNLHAYVEPSFSFIKIDKN